MKTETKTEKKKYNYTQNQRVYFNLGATLPCGYGKIAGVVGPVLIIELEQPIKDYPFTHFYILDSQISEPSTVPFVGK